MRRLRHRLSLCVLSAGEGEGPNAVSHAAFKKQQHNPGVTKFVELANRGHALTIDHGWAEVAKTALDFISTHLPSTVA